MINIFDNYYIWRSYVYLNYLRNLKWDWVTVKLKQSKFRLPMALLAIISSIPWSREQKLFVFPSPWSTGCKLWFISLWFNWTFYINLKKLEKSFWRSYLGLYRTDRLVSLTLFILTFLQFPSTHLLLFFLLILANNCSFLVRPSRPWMGRLSPNYVCW